MKILSIGNSFSQDAHRWLSQLAAGFGDDIYTVNLHISGCSLERHWNNFVSQECAYNLEINGQFVKMSSIQDALRSESWDVITLQQVSHFSGMPETCEPYLTDLHTALQELSPNSKFLFHQTWAYETDSDHPGFANYGNDQSAMYQRIIGTAADAAKKLSCDVIPVGTVIQHIRKSVPEFNYAGGGRSLNRDGFHLTYTYGRYAAALTWYCVLTGKRPENVCFIPETEDEKADTKLLMLIHQAVCEALAN